MKKPFSYFLPIIASLSLLTTSCEQVDALSDNADVTGISILNSAPAVIELGNPEITGAENTIWIPLLYGKYEFPLHLSMVITTSEGVGKILAYPDGGTLEPNFIFEKVDEIKQFDVVAASGKVRRWTIKLLETQLDEQTHIARFDVSSHTPADAVLGAKANIKHTSAGVEIMLIHSTFPLDMVPTIELSAGAHINGYSVGDALNFSSVSNTLPLPVIAESGKTQTWTAKLIQCTDVGSLQTVPIAVKNRLNLAKNALNFDVDKGALKDITSNFDTGVIELQVTGVTEDSFPLTVSPGMLPINADAQIVGRQASDDFVFINYGDEITFYIIDNISANYIKWTVRLVQWNNTEADIMSFTVTDSQPSSVVLKSPVEILPANATINLTVTAGVNDFPLTVTAGITLSDGATVKNGSPLTFTTTFTTTDTEYDIIVVAENGAEKTWKVKIINADPSSNKRTETNVASYTVYEYTSATNPETGSSVTINPQAVIDSTNKTITLTITNWKKYFPLKLKANMELSTGARVTTSVFGATDELEFAAPTSTKSFTVMAEDNATTADWTIKFADEEPVKSNTAELVNFVIGNNISTGNTIDRYYIEPSKKQITILLLTNTFAGNAMRISPTVTVSSNAYLLDIESGEEITFAGFASEQAFRIMAEDETTINTWKIVLVNAPQLANWNLNAWTDNKTATDWSSPNATGITTMTQYTPGYEGTGYAAKLTSATASILIKVFASGSLFLGEFKYNISNASRPKLMTYFGIPWEGKPIALEADYTYSNGNQRIKPSGINFVNVSGDDYGSATIELLHWDGTGTFEYHTVTPEDNYSNYTIPTNITVTARSINDRIAPADNWSKLRLNLTTLDNTKIPNYIHVTFASSYEGDKQTGANGSTLKIDNVRLIYYEPEAGAIVGQ